MLVFSPLSSHFLENWWGVINFFLLASGFPLNVSKTTLIGINCSSNEIAFWACCFGCKVESFPCNYLGFPLGGNHRASNFWDPLVEKTHKCLKKWRSLLLSKGGRLTLAQSVLDSIPLYYFSILKAPVVVIKIMEKLIRDFI